MFDNQLVMKNCIKFFKNYFRREKNVFNPVITLNIENDQIDLIFVAFLLTPLSLSILIEYLLKRVLCVFVYRPTPLS